MINKSGEKTVYGQPTTDLKLVNVPWRNVVASDYMLVEGFRLDHLPAPSSTLHDKAV